MTNHDADLAAEAKTNGSDAILIRTDDRDLLGTYQRATERRPGTFKVTTAFGSWVSVPIVHAKASSCYQICELVITVTR
jgi:hypothetical protein